METEKSKANRVLRDARAIRSDFRDLAGDVAEVGREVRQRIDFRPYARAHPFRSVFIAAGAGYVLGGGLFTRWTSTALRIGARALLLPLLKQELQASVAGARPPA